MYKAYVTRIKNIAPIEKADRLNIGYCFDCPVVISKEYNEDDLYVYFPTGGQLSEEFCAANDLCRRKDENGNQAGGYLDPNKRNVVAVKLRGERSDGLVLPLSSLSSFGDINDLHEGDAIDVFNGHLICCKYIPKVQHHSTPKNNNFASKVKVNVAPLFKEHVDTEQLAYNLDAFKNNDYIEITLKMHGTSGRTGYLPCLKKTKRSLLDRILSRHGKDIYDYDYVTGTRRTICPNDNKNFRAKCAEKFVGKLEKGETVYYEIVGYESPDVPIMPIAETKVLKDKAFTRNYGERMVFSYGCKNGECEVYVYRMTMTNEDGYVVEYPPSLMRTRCEQMGVKTVPVLIQHQLSSTGPVADSVKNFAELYYEGPDPIDPTHIREGVVVRIVNRQKFCAYKHKGYNFKVLSGIAIEKALADGTLENMSDDQISEL